MTQTPDESPTQRQPGTPGPTWVGSASVPSDGTRRRRQWEDTAELPVVQPRVAPVPRTLDLPAAPSERTRKAPPPPKQPRPERVRYVQAPPGYRPGPIPPPWQFRKRRRKWPWVLLIMFLLCAGCCGGSYAWARQWWVQYPESVRLDAAVPGLTPFNDAAAKKTAEQFQQSLTSDQLDEQGFTAVYQDGEHNRVLLFGVTRFLVHPASDLEGSLRKLGTKTTVQGVRGIGTGPLGGEARCAEGRSSAICGWADHGMIAIVVFPDRSVSSAATAAQNLRAAITVRN